ncbi:hypothetical protein WHX55_22595 [Pseudomonas fluorescens]|uniref:hypothetical protein n=1 Tax=Pseudomonas fluorescens TaxID=294 RepID=UPI00324FC0E7
MASMVEMLNQGLGALNTPLGQFGVNMLMQAGPQAGNPGGGVRMGNALAGMSEMQKTQALQRYREQMIAQQEAAQNFQVQQARAKVEQQQRQQQALQSPELQSQLGGMARQLAALGMPLDDVLKAQSGYQLQQHRQASLEQQQSHFEQSQANRSAGSGADHGPKMPTPRQILDEPLGEGMIQRHVFDASTNGYKPYGKPFRQYAPTKADPMADLLNEVTPDDNAGAGAAVPGLPGSNVSMTPAPQGAALLMHGSGSNPMARKPAAPKTKAEYDALPAGATYVDPASGKTTIKKARG